MSRQRIFRTTVETLKKGPSIADGMGLGIYFCPLCPLAHLVGVPEFGLEGRLAEPRGELAQQPCQLLPSRGHHELTQVVCLVKQWCPRLSHAGHKPVQQTLEQVEVRRVQCPPTQGRGLSDSIGLWDRESSRRGEGRGTWGQNGFNRGKGRGRWIVSEIVPGAEVHVDPAAGRRGPRRGVVFIPQL